MKRKIKIISIVFAILVISLVIIMRQWSNDEVSLQLHNKYDNELKRNNLTFIEYNDWVRYKFLKNDGIEKGILSAQLIIDSGEASLFITGYGKLNSSMRFRICHNDICFYLPILSKDHDETENSDYSWYEYYSSSNFDLPKLVFSLNDAQVTLCKKDGSLVGESVPLFVYDAINNKYKSLHPSQDEI